jgi:hypothetical protein
MGFTRNIFVFTCASVGFYLGFPCVSVGFYLCSLGFHLGFTYAELPLGLYKFLFGSQSVSS